MEKFPFLFFVFHSSCGSALVLALPLWVGHPQACVPCPERRGLKQQLIRALLLTQVGEREEYGSHNWNVVVSEAGVKLQQPEVHHVFSWGSYLWIWGP